MSMKSFLPNLETVLTSAVRDPTFAAELVSDPVKAAKQLGIDLGAQELEMLNVVVPHMKRFGSDPNRTQDDANSWAVGILCDKVVPVWDGKNWEPGVTSIQRRHTSYWP